EAHYHVTRVLLERAERSRFALDWARSYSQARATMAEQAHDIYLVDYFLEDRTGLDLIRDIARGENPMPVIMLTGKGDRSVDMEAMKAGAADYLVKGHIDPQALERSILYALESHAARRALMEAEARSRRTFERLPIGLFRIDEDGELIEANPALQEILGYPDEALLRNGYARDLFVSPAHAVDVRVRLAKGGSLSGFASELTKVDGTAVAVSVSLWTCDLGQGRTYLEGTVERLSERPHPAAAATAASKPRLP
ncbi:MAG: response regulator, partial [Gemmatimonadota bacterium]|nr:response regulator [Gemmatimonadota bacterium]